MSDDVTTCAELRPLLRDATRGRLDQRQARAVTAHLGTCAACRATSEEERELDQLLEERLPQHPAPLALKRRLAARLPPVDLPMKRASTRSRRWAVLALPLAACAALVLVFRPHTDVRDPLVDEAIS
ncbi:MAG TPA: zf-HC2 domain-containing protein, partial [Polyangia bacterium]|nr:zf-HC2 domain-containing protein [Polyangia bacterium]